MALKSVSWLTIALVILAVILFVIMLNFVIRVALLMLIVLGIIWLWKQIQTSRRRKK